LGGVERVGVYGIEDHLGVVRVHEKLTVPPEVRTNDFAVTNQRRHWMQQTLDGNETVPISLNFVI
jgi:hypothetical protein